MTMKSLLPAGATIALLAAALVGSTATPVSAQQAKYDTCMQSVQQRYQACVGRAGGQATSNCNYQRFLGEGSCKNWLSANR
jgi:hypothetical protein